MSHTLLMLVLAGLAAATFVLAGLALLITFVPEAVTVLPNAIRLGH